jgi:hypothetical protein
MRFFITLGTLAEELGVPLDGTSSSSGLTDEDADLEVEVYRDDGVWHVDSDGVADDEWAPSCDAQAAELRLAAVREQLGELRLVSHTADEIAAALLGGEEVWKFDAVAGVGSDDVLIGSREGVERDLLGYYERAAPARGWLLTRIDLGSRDEVVDRYQHDWYREEHGE